MKFNKNWTKEDNDFLRKMIKDGKSYDDIREYFGNNKLFYHPNKKYYVGEKSCLPIFNKKIEDFTGFINEIKYKPLKTDFEVDFKESKYFSDFDYIYKFSTQSGNKYILDFIYLRDDKSPFPNNDFYNISFTTESNQKPTTLNEQHELIKRLIFIFKDFENRFANNNSIYLIGETEDERKILWY